MIFVQFVTGKMTTSNLMIPNMKAVPIESVFPGLGKISPPSEPSKNVLEIWLESHCLTRFLLDVTPEHEKRAKL
jgi:hypothetical protein